MNMFSHISTQIGVLGASLCEQATETRTALKTQAETQEKSVKQLATDVDKKLDIHKLEFKGMLKDTNNTVEKLAMRLASLEAGKKTMKGDSDAMNDDLIETQRDPWARSKWGSSALVGAPASTPPPAAPVRSASSASEFHPEFVHLKGWSFYGEKGTGLSQANALALGARVKSRLPEDIQSLIINTRAPMLVNYQVSFRVARGEGCWRLQEAVRQVLLEFPEIIGGRQAYSVVDQSPTARRKNATIAKARAALLKAAPKPDNVKADFRAAVIYWAPNPNSDEGLLALGKMTKNGSWAWTPECVREALPDLALSALTAATAEEMAD
jgi:hypothetical protein